MKRIAGLRGIHGHGKQQHAGHPAERQEVFPQPEPLPHFLSSKLSVHAQAGPGGVPATQYFSSAQQAPGPVQPAVTPKVLAPVPENVTSYEISPYR